jgi:hypothetical protein
MIGTPETLKTQHSCVLSQIIDIRTFGRELGDLPDPETSSCNPKIISRILKKLINPEKVFQKFLHSSGSGKGINSNQLDR